MTLYFQSRYTVDDATAAGVMNLQAAGFSATDALAGDVTDLRSAGCPGLEVRNLGVVKVRFKERPLCQYLECSFSAVSMPIFSNKVEMFMLEDVKTYVEDPYDYFAHFCAFLN